MKGMGGMDLDMRSAGIALLLGLAAAPAGAVVGGREAPETAGSAVMVLSSNGGVCTGIVVAQDSVLTAGHCVAAGSRQGGAEHRVHFRDEAGQPVLVDLAARAVHPGYDAGAIAGRRRSIDLALVRTATPLPGRFRPTPLSAALPRAGESLVLSGYGVSKPGEPRTTGTFRSAVLPVVEPYGQEPHPGLDEAVRRRIRRLPGRFRRADRGCARCAAAGRLRLGRGRSLR